MTKGNTRDHKYLSDSLNLKLSILDFDADGTYRYSHSISRWPLEHDPLEIKLRRIRIGNPA